MIYLLLILLLLYFVITAAAALFWSNQYDGACFTFKGHANF